MVPRGHFSQVEFRDVLFVARDYLTVHVDVVKSNPPTPLSNHLPRPPPSENPRRKGIGQMPFNSEHDAEFWNII